MKQAVTLFFLVAVSSTTWYSVNAASSPSTCKQSDEKCEFWLEIEERLVLHKDNIRVYAKDGVLYKHDEGPGNHQTNVSEMLLVLTL